MAALDPEFVREAEKAISSLMREAKAEHLRDDDFDALVAERLDEDEAFEDPQKVRARTHLRACDRCAQLQVRWATHFVKSRQSSPASDEFNALLIGGILWLFDRDEASVRAAAIKAVPLLLGPEQTRAWADPVLARLDAALEDVDERVRAAAAEVLEAFPPVKEAALAVAAETEPAARAKAHLAREPLWNEDADTPRSRWSARAAASLRKLRDDIQVFLTKIDAFFLMPDAVFVAGGKTRELAQHKTETWSLSLTQRRRDRIVQIAGKAPELAGRKINVALAGRHACTMVLEADGDIVRATGVIPPELRINQEPGPHTLQITIPDVGPEA
jgi:hypothetical protein